MIADTIQWQEAEPDVHIGELDQLLVQSNWANSIAVVRNALAGQSVYFSYESEDTIARHLAEDVAELGGLLLGRVYRLQFSVHGNYPWVTRVERALPSREYRNSSVSLRMGVEVWTRAGEQLHDGLMVVGWYHSHPNLGAFFSGTDRATQAAFFNHPYALGLVVDPVRKERKCFFGGAAEELPAGAMTVI